MITVKNIGKCLVDALVDLSGFVPVSRGRETIDGHRLRLELTSTTNFHKLKSRDRKGFIYGYTVILLTTPTMNGPNGS